VLRKAAVEYALGSLGWVLRPRGNEGREKVAGVAAALGVALDEMWEWMGDKRYFPEGLGWKKGEAHGAEEEEWTVDGADDLLTVRAAEAVELPEGAGLRDVLSEMVGGDDDTLSEGEKAEMASALEAGLPLTRGQRLGLAVALRGCGLAGRREVVRAVLDWVSPPDKQVEEIWEVREEWITVPAGAVWGAATVAVPVGNKKIGRARLVVTGRDGAVILVRNYCLVKTVEARKDSVGLRVRRLVPVARFAKEHVLHQFALLASMVRQEGRTGKEWGALFGREGKAQEAIVSYHNKRMVRRIQGATGSKVGVRGLRNVDDPRRGKRVG